MVFLVFFFLGSVVVVLVVVLVAVAARFRGIAQVSAATDGVDPVLISATQIIHDQILLRVYHRFRIFLAILSLVAKGPVSSAAGTAEVSQTQTPRHVQ